MTINDEIVPATHGRMPRKDLTDEEFKAFSDEMVRLQRDMDIQMSPVTRTGNIDQEKSP